ncbi:fimbrial protein [Helicobacter pylori]|jgi:type 1 fimbria pilin
MLCVLAFAAVSDAVQAQGHCSSSPAMPYMQTMNNMAVVVSLAVGEEIPGTRRNYTISGRCVADGNRMIYAGAPIVACYYGSGREITPGVYSTGAAGIGIRLRNAAGQPMVNAADTLCDTRAAALGTLAADLSYAVSVSIEFVKTGAISKSQDSLNPAQTRFGFGVYRSGVGLGSPHNAGNYIGFTGIAAPRQITCTTRAPTNVTLPDVTASSLTGYGSTAGFAPFSIGLTCDGEAVVGISFDGASGTPVRSASTGVLGIQTENSFHMARGVGMQLIDGNTYTPVPLQTRNHLGRISANRMASYRYAFRYYSLSNRPSWGPVRGTMVFTFDYQ